MGIQLTTNNQFPASISYGTSGTYTGDISFSTNSLGLSSVSAINVTAMTLGLSTLGIPNVSFALSGVTLPAKLLVTAGQSQSIYYTITANNNYLHASTIYSNVTSNLIATAVLSADTSIGGETSSYSTSFNSGILTLAGDAGAPNPPTNFTAVGDDKVVALTWTNTVGGDWANTVIEESTVAPVTSVGMGTVVYTATAASMSAVSVPVSVLGTEVYYYGAYSTDNVAKTSTLVTATPVASALPTWGVWTSLAEHSRNYIQGTF